jgi:hypothetical protein
VFLTKIVDHGGRHGNAMQALTRWQHPVASSEARDVLYWASYRRIRMAIEIASYLPSFFVVVNLLLPITIAK